MAEVYAALIVDFDNFDLELVANLDHVFDFLDAAARKLGDVTEAFLARQDFDEGTEFHQSGYLARVDFADFDFTDDVFNHLFCLLHAL